MVQNNPFLLTVYFDGLCMLCSAEISHYKKQIGSEKINFISITSSEFDAVKERLDPFKIHKVMHARTNSGQVLIKMDAFIAIWEILPKYNWLYHLSKKLIIRKLMDIGYILFATVRPYLPRKNKESDCESSPYCPTHIKPK